MYFVEFMLSWRATLLYSGSLTFYFEEFAENREHQALMVLCVETYSLWYKNNKTRKILQHIYAQTKIVDFMLYMVYRVKPFHYFFAHF